MYELPYELPNDLSLSILGNLEISGKSQDFIELFCSAQSSFRNEKLIVGNSKNLIKDRS